MKSRETLIRVQRFNVDEKRRQLADIDLMIAEFKQKQADLNHQIEVEQERAGISDVTHFAYPTFAKAAIGRRENLAASIAGLETQREAAGDQLSDAVAELKRLELLNERDKTRRRSALAKSEQMALDEAGRAMFRG
ncbi:MAG: flagellar export protein FliJ [Alphaproteobacteria bacterium]